MVIAALVSVSTRRAAPVLSGDHLLRVAAGHPADAAAGRTPARVRGRSGAGGVPPAWLVARNAQCRPGRLPISVCIARTGKCTTHVNAHRHRRRRPRRRQQKICRPGPPETSRSSPRPPPARQESPPLPPPARRGPLAVQPPRLVQRQTLAVPLPQGQGSARTGEAWRSARHRTVGGHGVGTYGRGVLGSKDGHDVFPGYVEVRGPRRRIKHRHLRAMPPRAT
jgi:hypothetical protein